MYWKYLATKRGYLFSVSHLSKYVKYLILSTEKEALSNIEITKYNSFHWNSTQESFNKKVEQLGWQIMDKTFDGIFFQKAGLLLKELITLVEHNSSQLLWSTVILFKNHCLISLF